MDPEKRNQDEVTIQAALDLSTDEIKAAETEAKKTVPVAMALYNGGVVQQWFGRVVLDISGVALRQPQVKVLADHYHPVGFATDVDTSGGKVTLIGQIIRDQDDQTVMQILNKAAAGFVWEASIGARMLRVEMLEDGETTEVNGQEVVGPLRIARESEILEGSIVVFGADNQGTQVDIAARRQNQNKESDMDPKDTKEVQGGGNDNGAQTPAITSQDDVRAAQEQAREAVRAAAADEMNRVNAIRGFEAHGDEAESIRAKAIAEGWDTTKAELEILRASRQAPAIATPAVQNVSAKAIEASVLLYHGADQTRLEASYEPEVLEVADRLRCNSLKAMLEMHFRANGMPVPGRNAKDSEWIRAAFSANSVSTLVSNVAHKVMLEGFELAPSTATQVARKLTANDFKTHTGVRLKGNRKFEKVGPGGEIKHGEYSEDSYTFSVDTYGKMFGITRQMMRNDDLGELMETVRLLGEGAFLAREEGFWTYFLSNPGSIFASGNNNVTTGGMTDAGLTAAVKILREMKDGTSDVTSGGAFVLAIPDRILVSPAQADAAQKLYVSRNLIGQGNDAVPVADRNIHEGLYRPIVSPYVGANGLSSGSDTTWYMFARNINMFGIAYLDGRETPIIEDVGLSGEYLGQAWRGYYDFGFCTIDEQGAVKVTAS